MLTDVSGLGAEPLVPTHWPTAPRWTQKLPRTEVAAPSPTQVRIPVGDFLWDRRGHLPFYLFTPCPAGDLVYGRPISPAAGGPLSLADYIEEDAAGSGAAWL